MPDINSGDDSVSRDLEDRRLPYHAPRSATLGSVQALVKLGDFPGSDGGPGTDCAFGS